MWAILIWTLLAGAPEETSDFERGDVGSRPARWFAPMGNIDAKVSDQAPRQGKRCLRLQKTDNRFGNLLRSIDAAATASCGPA